MLSVEVVEGCNFKCYFCTARDLTGKKFMDLGLFKRIVSEAAEMGFSYLNLVPTKGEIFLHPDIYEMLEFANSHMKEILVFTNATAINVDQLKKINRNNINLHVSYYGTDKDMFSRLTCVDSKMKDIVDKRLHEMDQCNIEYVRCERTDEYPFDYDIGTFEKLDINVKCRYHYQPKIFANGEVSFCIFAKETWPDSSKIQYTNVSDKPLQDVLSDPLRYKFYESQSVCESCDGYARNCAIKTTFPNLKLMNSAKQQYIKNKQETDQRYTELENEITQSNLQSTQS